MRSKTLGINVRVTPEEKEKLLKTPITVRFLFQNICGGWGLERMLKPQSERKITDFSAVKATESRILNT